MISELLNKNKYKVRLNITLTNTIIIAYLIDKQFRRFIKTLEPFEYNSFLHIPYFFFILSIFCSINCSITTSANLRDFIKVTVLHVRYTIIISYEAVQ